MVRLLNLNKKMIMVPKETAELINAIFDTTAEAFRSFGDGVGLDDIPKFFDEAIGWPKAVQGIGKLGEEAMSVDDKGVEELFESQRGKLVEAGVNQMLAGAIITNAKGLYYVFAAIKQGGGDAVKE